ncbi:MAG: CARDB domain-containing protein [Thermoplasmata archaeon]
MGVSKLKRNDFCKRRLSKDGSAVSEVVGTILVLSITVVLFSTIFAAVTRLESPERTAYLTMEANFSWEVVDEEMIRTITIEHKGGHPINIRESSLHIVSYDERVRSHRFMFDDEEIIEITGRDEQYWDIGGNLMLNVTELPDKLSYEDWSEMENSVDRLTVLIITHGGIVWDGEVFISGILGERPYVKEAGVVYPQPWHVAVDAGEDVSLYANIEWDGGDLNDIKDNVMVDLGRIEGFQDGGAWGSNLYNMSRQGNRFVYPHSGSLTVPREQDNGTYLLRIYIHTGNEDISRELAVNGTMNNSVAWSRSEYITLNVGRAGVVGEEPDLRVNIQEFIPVNPTNRDSVTVRATIENYGGSSARMNISFYDRLPHEVYDELDYGENIGFIEHLHVAAGGGRDLQVTWQVNGSGEHEITVELHDIFSTGGSDASPDLNIDRSELFVSPIILLVDDTQETYGSDGRAMKGALDGLDQDYRYTNSPPLWDEGEFPLKEQDLVIWMTGRTRRDLGGDNIEMRRTLTEADRENLAKFIEEGGFLWLVGEGILNDAQENGWDGWLQDNLHAEIDIANADAPFKSLIYGIDTPFTEGQHYPATGTWKGGYIDAIDEGTLAMTDGDGGGGLGVSWEGGRNRTMFNSYMFRSVEPGSRLLMAGRVLEWLGNISQRHGNDLALIDQKFDGVYGPIHPMYQQEVNVTGTILNNGVENMTNVEVRLKVNGNYLRGEDYRKYVNITEGETKDVTFYWTAEPVGVHEILVVVDPYNRVEETTQENNDIRYTDVDYTVNVRFSVMLVNARVEGEDTPLQSTLEELGYAHNIYTYQDESIEDENGDPIDINETLKRYNTVYWDAGEVKEAISGDVLESIKEFLDKKEGTSFFLSGDNVLEHIREVDSGFIDDVMGISGNLGDIGNVTNAPHEIRGEIDDELGHGMEYSVDGEDGSHTTFVLNGGHGFAYTYHNDEKDALIGARNDYEDSKVIFLGMDLARLTGPVYLDDWYDDFQEDIDLDSLPVQTELTYMVTDHLGNVDERVELKISSVDISVEEQQPMLGRSYLLSATITNLGHSPSDALVRFKDGDSHIASESMYIPSGGSATAEVMWRPLFAGPVRPVRVLVDPRCTVDEIGDNTMGFNNHALIETPVYYFWDDMESGADNWETEATIMNVNGEHPLEYLSGEYDSVYTEIIDDWDNDMSEGINNTDEYAFSDPYSYHLKESVGGEISGGRLPIDMGVMVDTTGSMSGDKIEDAKIATKDLIDMFDENDRVALFNLDSYHKDDGSFLWEDFRYMTDDNKDFFKSRVDDFTASGGTPLWDASGYTLNHVIDNPRPTGIPDEDYVQATILFTDGDDEHFADDPPERGSNIYAPGCVRGVGPLDHTWGVDGGHEWGDDAFDYRDQGGSNNDVLRWDDGSVDWIELLYRRSSSRSTERLALVNAPMLTYTVALGTSPSAYLPSGDASYMSPFASEYPFTSEYQLIQIAKSTNGSYFYAPDSDQLGGIFQQIFSEVVQESAEAGNVTSIPDNDIAIYDTGTEYTSRNSWAQTTETRYMKTTTWDVNGLDTYRLESDGPGLDFDTVGDDIDSNVAVTWGIRVWARDEMGGTEEITTGTPVAQVSRSSNGEGIQSATWTPPYSSISTTDSIVVRVYDRFGSGAWNQRAEFTTEQLGAVSLRDNEWTVYYYTQRDGYWWTRTYSYFSWGDEDHNSRIEGFTHSDSAINPPDSPTNPNPTDGATSVSTTPSLSVYVSHPDDKAMDVAFFDASNDNLIGFDLDVPSGTRTPGVRWYGLEYEVEYSWYAIAFDGTMTNESATWSFTTVAEGEDPDDLDPGEPGEQNTNKTAITPSFSLQDYQQAGLVFRSKYRMVTGTNGGFVMVGVMADEDLDADWVDEHGYAWTYAIPTEGAYTSNLDMDVTRTDSFGNDINFAWSGTSGGGAFGWDRVQINVLRYVPEGYEDDVRIMFNYTQYGGGTGYGWYLDDVRMVVSRGDNDLTDSHRDVWRTEEVTGWDGNPTTAWRNAHPTDPDGDYLKSGIDNSLITTSIDLTNARNATLSAYFKFNFNIQSGAPPDGFRVEITTDGGRTWQAINLGVRTSWGVSGGGDGYQGTDIGHGWTSAESLARLETDLSDFRGEVIRIRFRMITTTGSYNHYDDPGEDAGFYVDNVIVSGSSIEEG